MRFYQFASPSCPIQLGFSVAIDPGLSSTGVSRIDFQQNKLTCGVVTKDPSIKPLDSTLPALQLCFERQWRNTLREYPFMFAEPKNTEFVIEYTFLQGQFSPGLTGYITFITAQLRAMGASLVSMVPPKAPEWFLKLRSVSDKETQTFTRSLFPKLPPRIATHACDAVLLNLLRHYNYANRTWALSLRVPSPEIEVYQWDTLERLSKTLNQR